MSETAPHIPAEPVLGSTETVPIPVPIPDEAPVKLIPPSGVGNPRMAVAAYLKRELGSELNIEGRVYSPEIPKELQDEQPQACIVVTPSGGGHLTGRDRLPVFDSVMDISCFGSSRREAETVGDAALAALREMEPETFLGVRLHWVRIAGGVDATVDPATLWIYTLIMVQVLHSQASEIFG